MMAAAIEAANAKLRRDTLIGATAQNRPIRNMNGTAMRPSTNARISHSCARCEAMSAPA